MLDNVERVGPADGQGAGIDESPPRVAQAQVQTSADRGGGVRLPRTDPLPQRARASRSRSWRWNERARLALLDRRHPAAPPERRTAVSASLRWALRGPSGRSQPTEIPSLSTSNKKRGTPSSPRRCQPRSTFVVPAGVGNFPLAYRLVAQRFAEQREPVNQAAAGRKAMFWHSRYSPSLAEGLSTNSSPSWM